MGRLVPGAAFALIAALVSGCEREPLDATCPDVGPGELVISEVRGPQSTPDALGQWIELYNASGRALDLTGLILRVQRIDGGAQAILVVRRPGVTLAAGDYVVLGQAEDGDEPAHIDYGYLVDYDGDLYDDGGLTAVSCGDVIDQVVYRDLPGAGSLSLDGAADPDAQLNDEANAADPASAWCIDGAGTPGERNPTCS